MNSFSGIINTTDDMFRVIFVFIIYILLIQYSTLFEEKYHRRLVDLYIYPWWRLLIVLLLLSAILWCPHVGLLLSLATFFYLSDMNLLIYPLPQL
jgi:hypothetical protein